MVAILSRLLAALVALAGRVLLKTLVVTIKPLAAAMLCWISVMLIAFIGHLADDTLVAVLDEEASTGSRVAFGAALLISAPFWLPYWAAMKAWRAIQTKTGTGLSDLSAF
jgi:hypothetical protein